MEWWCWCGGIQWYFSRRQLGFRTRAYLFFLSSKLHIKLYLQSFFPVFFFFTTSCPASRSKKPIRHLIRAPCPTLTLHGLTTKVNHVTLTTRQMMVSMNNFIDRACFLSRCLVDNYFRHCSSQDSLFHYPIHQPRSKLHIDKLDI